MNSPSASNLVSKLRILKNKKFFLPITAAILLLGIGAVMIVINNDDSPSNPDSQSQKFPDYLKPSSTIKVGDQRYVSTCQVLTKTDIEKLYGKLSGESYMSEDYLDSSVPKDDLPVATRCLYGTKVTLGAEQYSDPAKANDLSGSVYSLGDEDMDAKILAYEKAANSSGDQGLKDFVGRMKSSVATYKKVQKSYLSGDQADNTKHDGIVLPVSSNAFEFNILYGNVMYRFEYDTGNDLEEDLAMPADKMTAELKRIKETIDILSKNAQNSQLSQSPTATILGSTDKNKQTRIVEPCAVLTAVNFKEITGLDQNDVIKRQTVPVDVVTERFAKTDKIQLFPTNSCERKNQSPGVSTTSTRNTSVSLELQYGDSEASVTKKLTDGYVIGADDTMLQTKADWAVEFVVPIGDSKPYYMFRVGNYLGIVGIDKLSSEGLGSDIIQTQASREEHVKAINLIVESLQAQIKSTQK